MAQNETDTLLQNFLTNLGPLRKRSRGVYLYGSRARGDFRPDSDLDLLMVIDQKDPKFRDQIWDAAYKTFEEKLKLVSVKVLPEPEFERLKKLGSPFIQRVLHEGKKVG